MNIQNINKKTLIIVCAIIILIIFLISRNSTTSSARLELKGNNKIVLNQYEKYNEYGYNIINGNSGYYVNIYGKVNTNIIGTYNVSYNLYDKNAVLLSTVIRKVIVVGDNSNITLTLNGEEVEYYFVGDYQDKGASAYKDYVDISNSITTQNSVIENQNGKYTVEYMLSNYNKVIAREVNIVDLDIKKEILKNNSSINLEIKNIGYDHIVLPDGKISYANKIIYKYDTNNTRSLYDFDIYLRSGSHKKYTVLQSEVATEIKGTCTLSFQNNTTTITMNVSNSSNTRYNVNGLDFYGTTKTINGYYGNVTVKAYNESNEETTIKCKNIMTNDFKTINTNKIGYFPYYMDVSNDNKELEAYVESYGYKTREGVVAAALYLVNYKYDIPYSFGGKYNKKGLNREWMGKKEINKLNKPCTFPLTDDHSYCKWGLDCTGYTRWAFFQAGFDKSITRDDEQSESKWGEFSAKAHRYKFNSQNINYINQIKPGDLIHREDHIGLVIGVSSDKLQVAEMLGPVQVNIYDKFTGKSLGNQRTWEDFVLFDDYYNMYGNK